VYKDGEITKYQGPRSFDGLLEFVDSELASKCDVEKAAETCSEKAPGYITKWKAKNDAAVQTELKRLTGMQSKPMEKHLKGKYFRHNDKYF
jgi:hypothetical protein